MPDTLLTVIIIAAAVLVLAILVVTVHNRIQTNFKLQARNDAIRSKNRFVSDLNSLINLESTIVQKLKVMREQISDEVLKVMETELKNFVTSLNTLRSLANKTELVIVEGLSLATYTTIIDTFNLQAPKIKATLEAGNHILNWLTETEELIKDSILAFNEANRQITQATATIEGIAAQGYTVQAASSQLIEARSILSQAQDALTIKNYKQAIELCVGAVRQATEARAKAERLPTQHAAALAQYQALHDQLERVETVLLPHATQTLASLRTQFVSYYIDEVAKGVTQLQNALAAVKLQEAAIAPLLEINRPGWDEALKATDRQIIKLKDIVDGLEVVAQTEAYLAEMTQQTVEGIENAQASVESAAAFALNHISKVEGLLPWLSQEEEAIAKIAALSGARPRRIDDEHREIAAAYKRLTALIKALQTAASVTPTQASPSSKPKRARRTSP